MREQRKIEKQLRFRLHTSTRIITQAYTPLLSGIGLTYPQYLVMMVLWEQDAQPVNDIAKRLYLETNTVTPLLKRMEAEGFIKREKGSEDGRKVIVSLTPKGKALEEQAACIPFEISGAAACRSITEETAPELYRTMDDLIETLNHSLLP